MNSEYNYENRWDATVKAWTLGAEEARRFGLDKNWKNWSPVQIKIHQQALVAGLLIGIIAGAILF